MTEIVDRYGRLWTDQPPPGSFNRSRDAQGRPTYCVWAPLYGYVDGKFVTLDDHYALVRASYEDERC